MYSIALLLPTKSNNFGGATDIWGCGGVLRFLASDTLDVSCDVIHFERSPREKGLIRNHLAP